MYDKFKIINSFINKAKKVSRFRFQFYDLNDNFELNERLEGVKLFFIDLLSRLKVFYIITLIVIFFVYLFFANLAFFEQFIVAIVQLVKEGKVSRSVAY